MSETDTKPKADTRSDEFSGEQKRYLEGLVSGLQANRAAQGLKPLGEGNGAAASEPTGPDAAHLKAQAATEASGKKLVDPEKWKRVEHPFDAYARLKDQAARNEFPKPPDNLP